jgi:hypothetical protein
MKGKREPAHTLVKNQLGLVCGSNWRVSSFDELISSCQRSRTSKNHLRGRLIAPGEATIAPGRVTISEDVARTELARKLVQLSRDGVRDEWRLSAAALNHLHDITPKDGNTNILVIIRPALASVCTKRFFAIGRKTRSVRWFIPISVGLFADLPNYKHLTANQSINAGRLEYRRTTLDQQKVVPEIPRLRWPDEPT